MTCRSGAESGACVATHPPLDRPPSLHRLRRRCHSALFEASQVLQPSDFSSACMSIVRLLPSWAGPVCSPDTDATLHPALRPAHRLIGLDSIRAAKVTTHSAISLVHESAAGHSHVHARVSNSATCVERFQRGRAASLSCRSALLRTSLPCTAAARFVEQPVDRTAGHALLAGNGSRPQALLGQLGPHEVSVVALLRTAVSVLISATCGRRCRDTKRRGASGPPHPLCRPAR